MAKIKLQGHASGSGIITLTAPNTSTDRTITLPDATATIATTTDVAARLPSITDGGNATAITITSAERIGINHTTPEARLEIDGGNETGLMVRSTVAAEYPAIFQSASTGTVPIADFRNNGGTSQLKVLSDGRGLSQFTAKAWCNGNFNDGSPDIQDSFNVSSVEYMGSTGYFAVHWDVDTANGDYASFINCYSEVATQTGYVDAGFAQNSSYLRFQFYRNGSLYNPAEGHLVIFGD
jgi:hypothetical protein